MRRVALHRRVLSPGLRHQPFSSSQSSSSLWDYGKRVLDRQDDFQRYVDSGVFDPANSTAKNYALFCLLQRPINTKVDAVEFLQGAQVAFERVFNGMFSSELMGPLSGKESVKPAVADEMEAMFTPGAYQTWLLPKLWTNKGARIRGSKIRTFTGVHLTGVSMKRMTLASYKIDDPQERALGMELAKLQKVGPLENYKLEELMKEFDGETMTEFVEKEMSAITAEGKATKVERLRLSVAFNFLLSVDGDSSEEARGGNTHSNVVRFESLVTHADEVDWESKSGSDRRELAYQRGEVQGGLTTGSCRMDTKCRE